MNINNSLQNNTFFDINKFPKEWGIIVFPISMSRIANTQSPQKCGEALDFFLSKISINQVGANYVYSEGLYMNFEKDAFKTKDNFAKTATSHMQGVKKFVKKNYNKFQINSAFHFDSWFQMYLSNQNFFKTMDEVRKFYKNDKNFRKYVAADAKEQKRKLDERQLSFYLEEHTFVYLLLNEKMTLQNDFVNERQRWILLTYPGNPPRGQVYLYQNDPLKINSESSNPYKGQYNLLSKKFIDYNRVDLETF